MIDGVSRAVTHGNVAAAGHELDIRADAADMDGLCIWMGCVVLVESISPNKPIYACRCLIFFLNNRSHHKLDVCTQTNTPTLQIAISFEKTEIA